MTVIVKGKYYAGLVVYGGINDKFEKEDFIKLNWPNYENFDHIENYYRANYGEMVTYKHSLNNLHMKEKDTLSQTDYDSRIVCLGKDRKLYIPKHMTEINFLEFESDIDVNIIEVDKDNPVYDSRENCNAVIETAKDRLLISCSHTHTPKNVKPDLSNMYYRWFCDFVNEETGEVEFLELPDYAKYRNKLEIWK